jgi:hypothetical protein
MLINLKTDGQHSQIPAVVWYNHGRAWTDASPRFAKSVSIVVAWMDNRTI